MRISKLLFTACAVAVASMSLASMPASAATEMEQLAKRLGPGDFTPRVEFLLKNNNPAQALELADLGIKANPRNAQLQFLRTTALERLGRTEEAAKGLRSMIGAYPEIPEPYNNLAVIEAGMGNLEEALTLLSQALRINPSFATALKNKGDVHLALALENYEAAAPVLSNNTQLQTRLKALRRLTGSKAAD